MPDPQNTAAGSDPASYMLDQASRVEVDRQARMQKFADDRMERVRKAKADRLAELALAEQKKMDEARRRLAGFENIEQARAAIFRTKRSARLRSRIKFTFCVLVPTVLVAVYLSKFATPFYEARTTFAVRAQEETPGQRPKTGAGIFGIGSPDGLRDAFLARAYLMSPEMLDALNTDTGFLERVSGEMVDPVSARRLPYLPQPSPFATYQRYVRADIDIQAGLITLTVRAPTPNEANLWAMKILDFTRARIDTTEQDRMRTVLVQSRTDTEIARNRLRDARSALTALQIGSGDTDPHARIAMTYNLIADLESEQQAADRALAALLMRFGTENSMVRRRAAESGLIAGKLEEYRKSISGDGLNEPLAARAAAFDQAKLDVELAQATWSERLRSEEATRMSVKRDRAVLSVVSAPHSPERQASPNVLKASFLAFLLLSGIYAFLTILGASFRHHGPHR